MVGVTFKFFNCVADVWKRISRVQEIMSLVQYQPLVFYFDLFYFILFYFVLFHFNLFRFILFYCILFVLTSFRVLMF
jgi:hypothetical protein